MHLAAKNGNSECLKYLLAAPGSTEHANALNNVREPNGQLAAHLPLQLKPLPPTRTARLALAAPCSLSDRRTALRAPCDLSWILSP